MLGLEDCSTTMSERLHSSQQSFRTSRPLHGRSTTINNQVSIVVAKTVPTVNRGKNPKVEDSDTHPRGVIVIAGRVARNVEIRFGNGTHGWSSAIGP